MRIKFNHEWTFSAPLNEDIELGQSILIDELECTVVRINEEDETFEYIVNEPTFEDA